VLGTTVPVSVSDSFAVAVVGTPVMSVTAINAGVEKFATGLSGDAKCVDVAALRCVKAYEVLGVNPLKTGEL